MKIPELKDKAIKPPTTGRVSLASNVVTTSADRLSYGHYLTHKELGWLKDLDCLLRKNLELKRFKHTKLKGKQ